MFTLDPGLPNEEISPFSEVEDEVLCNQPHKDDEEETEPISLIHRETLNNTTVYHFNLIPETTTQIVMNHTNRTTHTLRYVSIETT